MKSLLAILIFAGAAAFADQQTICIYRAPSSEGGLSKVVLTFDQDYTGYPMGGTVDVIQPSGRVNRVSLSGRDLFSLRAEGSSVAEIYVSLHMNSPAGRLDLEYLGNDFAFDTASWLGLRGRPNVDQLFVAYQEISERGGVRHRVEPGVRPVADFAAEVLWHGRPSNLRSSQFVCTSGVY